MAEIELNDERLIVHIPGFDKILAVRSVLDIPLEHVEGARVDPEVKKRWKNLWDGVRWPGTHFPGIIKAGTFFQRGKRVFYDVHDPDRAITIELIRERYHRIVVEVHDPDTEIIRINAAVQSRKASSEQLQNRADI